MIGKKLFKVTEFGAPRILRENTIRAISTLLAFTVGVSGASGLSSTAELNRMAAAPDWRFIEDAWAIQARTFPRNKMIGSFLQNKQIIGKSREKVQHWLGGPYVTHSYDVLKVSALSDVCILSRYTNWKQSQYFLVVNYENDRAISFQLIEKAGRTITRSKLFTENPPPYFASANDAVLLKSALQNDNYIAPDRIYTKDHHGLSAGGIDRSRLLNDSVTFAPELNRTASISFEVLDGNLKDVELKASSGNAQFDADCIRTVMGAQTQLAFLSGSFSETFSTADFANHLSAVNANNRSVQLCVIPTTILSEFPFSQLVSRENVISDKNIASIPNGSETHLSADTLKQLKHIYLDKWPNVLNVLHITFPTHQDILLKRQEIISSLTISK